MSKKLIFCTISLGDKAGGLEKNIINVANYFSNNNFSVDIITFDTNNTKSFYKINSNIKWHKIGSKKPHFKINFSERFKQIIQIRSIISKKSNSKIICFHHGISFRFLIANIFLKNKIFISERNSLSIYNYINKSKYNINYLCLFFVYKIFIQFDRYKEQYPTYLHKKIFTIPNYVEEQKNFSKNYYNKKENVILSIGRLEDQKNFDILINIFQKISINNPDWKLIIVGNGSKKKLLQNLIIKKKLDKKIIIENSTLNISYFYEISSIFCLLSKWEGFCNSVSESLSYGVPCVGLKSSDGICDLIEHEYNGLLANNEKNEKEIEICLQRLIEDKELRFKYGNNAKNSVKKYNKSKILKVWKENLLN